MATSRDYLVVSPKKGTTRHAILQFPEPDQEYRKTFCGRKSDGYKIVTDEEVQCKTCLRVINGV